MNPHDWAQVIELLGLFLQCFGHYSSPEMKGLNKMIFLSKYIPHFVSASALLPPWQRRSITSHLHSSNRQITCPSGFSFYVVHVAARGMFLAHGADPLRSPLSPAEVQPSNTENTALITSLLWLSSYAFKTPGMFVVPAGVHAVFILSCFFCSPTAKHLRDQTRDYLICFLVTWVLRRTVATY